MQLRVIAHIAAGNNKVRQPQDVLPAEPAVKAQQHIAADGKIQLRAGVLLRQLFHREHGVIALSRFGLCDLPAADFQLRDVRAVCQRAEAAAHFQPQRPRCRGALFEG